MARMPQIGEIESVMPSMNLECQPERSRAPSVRRNQVRRKQMDPRMINFRVGKVCMFWDVEDYPLPDGDTPCWMKGKIKDALKREGFSGELSIQAYVDEKTFTTELERKYLDADIKLFTLCKGNKYAKVSAMFVDVLLWAFENPDPANLIVLSKGLGETGVYSVLQGLHRLCYRVLSPTTQLSRYLPGEAEVRFLTSLFDGDGATSSAP